MTVRPSAACMLYCSFSPVPADGERKRLNGMNQSMCSRADCRAPLCLPPFAALLMFPETKLLSHEVDVKFRSLLKKEVFRYFCLYNSCCYKILPDVSQLRKMRKCRSHFLLLKIFKYIFIFIC